MSSFWSVLGGEPLGFGTSGFTLVSVRSAASVSVSRRRLLGRGRGGGVAAAVVVVAAGDERERRQEGGQDCEEATHRRGD